MIDNTTRELYKKLKDTFADFGDKINVLYGTMRSPLTHAFEFSLSVLRDTKKIIFLLEFDEEVESEYLTPRISCKYVAEKSVVLKNSTYKTFKVSFDKKNHIVTFMFAQKLIADINILDLLKECFSFESVRNNFDFANDEVLLSELDHFISNSDLIELTTGKAAPVAKSKPKRKKPVIVDPEDIGLPFEFEEELPPDFSPDFVPEQIVVPVSSRRKARYQAASKRELSATEQEFTRPIALEIGEELKKHVYGQDEYIERLALLIQEQLTVGRAKPLMVIGKTGSGKTYTIQMMMEHCKRVLPSDYEYIYADCSGLTEKGFTGGNVNELFHGIKAKRGIIFLDEVDKIIRVSSNGNGENVNLPVQTELMNYVSGKEITHFGRTINTGNFLFVLGGAFTDLYDLHAQKNHSYGFVTTATRTELSSHVSSAKVSDGIKMISSTKNSSMCVSSSKNVINLEFKDTTKEAVTLRNELVSIGASREFMGRVGAIVTLKELNYYDFKRILLDSVIPEKKETIKKCYNINFEFSDRAIDSIIINAMSNEYGARIIKTTVDNLVDSVIYPTINEMSNLNEGKKITPISLDIDYECDSYNYRVHLADA